jgi:hypothetical protein
MPVLHPYLGGDGDLHIGLMYFAFFNDRSSFWGFKGYLSI